MLQLKLNLWFDLIYKVLINQGLVLTNSSYLKGRFSIVDLFIKVGCFEKKKKKISVWKAADLN